MARDMTTCWHYKPSPIADNMFVKIVIVAAVFVLCMGQAVVEPPQDELFRYADANNDTRLTSAECKAFWLRFDGDGDHVIDKLEFELKWTFLNLNDAEHAPFFYRELDINYNHQVDEKEINRMCVYFDDDNDGYISKVEFDINWIGLFTLPSTG